MAHFVKSDVMAYSPVPMHDSPLYTFDRERSAVTAIPNSLAP